MIEAITLLSVLAPHAGSMAVGAAGTVAGGALKNFIQLRGRLSHHLAKELPENEDIERHVYMAHLQACRGLVDLIRGPEAKRSRGSFTNKLEKGLERADQSLERSIERIHQQESNWRNELPENGWNHNREGLEAALKAYQGDSDTTVEALTLALKQGAHQEIIKRTGIEQASTQSEFLDLISEEFDREDREYLPLFQLFIGEAIKHGDESFFRILTIKEQVATRTEIQQFATNLQDLIQDELKDSVVHLVEQFQFITVDVARIQRTLDDYIGQESRNNQPSLKLKQRRDSALSGLHARRRALPLIGRKNELSQLINFCDHRPEDQTNFQWTQLSGPGGTGKTRLALELAINRWVHGWRAGFIEPQELESFKDRWRNWQPEHDTLLIVDYVLDKPALVGHLVKTLDSCEEGWRGDYKVKLLLVERQSWRNQAAEDDEYLQRKSSQQSNVSNRAPNSASFTTGDAGWYEAMGLDQSAKIAGQSVHPVNLKPLESLELVSLVRRYVAFRGSSSTLSDDSILETLQRIDQTGRALYAYFLGEALAAGEEVHGWERGDLLSNVLERDRKNRWQVHFKNEAPQSGDDTPSLRLALLATMAQSVDVEQAETFIGLDDITNTDLREAQALVDGPVSGGLGGQHQRIVGLEPDILGEWFLLSFLDKPGIRSEILQAAWNINPHNTAATLSRIYQDFPSANTSISLLCDTPNNKNARSVHTKSVLSCIGKTDHLKIDLDPRLFQKLQTFLAEPTGESLDLLAYCFVKGWGTKVDELSAFNLYQEAAEVHEYPIAMFNLAACLENGTGVDEPDPVNAVKWYRRAAQEHNHPDAMFRLGVCLANGMGVDKPDPVNAVKWYRRAAQEHNHPDAMFNLAVCLKNGVDEPDPVNAVKWFRRAAQEHDDPDAMFGLAVCLKNGIGVDEPDPVNAVKWYRRAAQEHDHPDATFNLAVGLENGTGVDEPDPVNAVKWYRHAAQEHDHPDAMFNLAVCLVNGTGVDEPDPVNAVKWYRRAAQEHNHPPAMFNLAVCLENGTGVDEPDPVNAVKWYRRAAQEHDHSDAMFNLAVFLKNGTGVDEPDPVNAVKWYRRAAQEHNHPSAMFNLALCLVNGTGVDEPDLVTAGYWLRRAAEEHKHPEAIIAMARLTSGKDGGSQG